MRVAMHKTFTAILLLMANTAIALAQDEGDPKRGKRAFLKCVTCHSAASNVHKTGPSLAHIWGMKAATVQGFSRYSEALQSSHIVWNEETLDRWLREPPSLVPGTSMKMPGIASVSERLDIIAYLKQLTSRSAAAQGPASEPDAGRRGGMMGMMGASEPADISKPLPSQRIVSISHCSDTYVVTPAQGKTLKFWEFNLRFKTDSSDMGPPDGKPVLLPAGMMGGDRSFVIFHSPKEISGFIEEKC